MGACLVRALTLVVALGLVEVMWLRTGRGAVAAAGLVALGLLIAASVVAWPGWWWRALTGARTAVALVVLIIAACVAGTLFVQDAELDPREGEAARLNEFARRQGTFFWRLLHRTPAVRLSADQEAYFEVLAGWFGRRYARQERRADIRALAAEARSKAGEAFAARHRRSLLALHEVLWAVRLSDVFRAWWFAGLLAVLAVNVGFCSARRLRLEWRRIGFAGIHLGVVLVLIGAAIGRLTRTTGYIPVAVGYMSDRYQRAADDQEVPLGFSLALRDFRTDYRKELICSFPEVTGERLARAFRVEPGGVIRLGPQPVDRPERHAYTITVEEFIPRAWPAGTVEELSAEPRRPAIQISVERPDRAAAKHWLLSQADQYVIAEDNAYKLRFRFAPSKAAYDEILGRVEEESLGLLTLIRSQDGAFGVAELVVTGPGQTAVCDLGGRSYRVEVLEVWPDILARSESLPASRQFPRRPAVKVRLTDEQGTSGERWVFQDEYLQAVHPLSTLGDVETRYVLDGWSAPVPERYVIVGAPGQPLVLLAYVAGRRVAQLPAAAGKPLEVPGARTRLTLERFVGQAVFPLAADQTGRQDDPLACFDRGGQPGVRLRIDGPTGTDLAWLRANTLAWHAIDVDGQLRIEYRDNLQAAPEEYRALVGVYEEDRLVTEQVVEVNRPLRWRGYIFYQDDPRYRYLKVVRDPSLPVVYVGLAMVLAGTAAHFLIIKPFA